MLFFSYGHWYHDRDLESAISKRKALVCPVSMFDIIDLGDNRGRDPKVVTSATHGPPQIGRRGVVDSFQGSIGQDVHADELV